SRYRSPSAFAQDSLQLPALVEAPDRAGTLTGWNSAGELFHKLGDPFAHPLRRQVARQESDPARDVEADAAGGHHAAPLDVGGSHASDREAVAPVDVWHGIAGADDTRKVGHIRNLLQGAVGSERREQIL